MQNSPSCLMGMPPLLSYPIVCTESYWDAIKKSHRLNVLRGPPQVGRAEHRILRPERSKTPPRRAS